MKKKISITINEKILKEVDSVIDNLFIQNRSQAIEHLIQKTLEKSRPAVILAGEGRLNSKKLRDRYSLKVGHMTLIERAVKKLKESGFGKIFIVANHNTLTKIFKIVGDGSDYKINIEFVDEENENGSASALKLLKDKIGTTFLFAQEDMIIDNINIEEMWKQHLRDKSIVTMRVCSSIIPGKSARFGHVTLQGNKILSYVEKPAPKQVDSSIFFGGILIAEPEIFGCAGNSLELEVFPEIAKKGLLGGWMSATQHLHIHTKEDLQIVRKRIKAYNILKSNNQI